ncbi:MAG: N-acetylneuraminate synthase [Brevibacillus sp.]|nr:N-acetylneuraminate synthase [Brevibacillus sp.]
MRHVFIIAEAGVNHNGSLDMALQLIDAASLAGADAVKFQTFFADSLAIKKAEKAEYQKRETGNNESQWEMLKRLEISPRDHYILLEHCRKRGIQFLSTPFDIESAKLLAENMDLPMIKISSGDLTNAPLLMKVAESGKPIILSTGMSVLGEIESALGVLAFGYTQPNRVPSAEAFREAYQSVEGQQALKEKVTLLHCTTEYPTAFSDVNLRVMDTLKHAFQLPVGLSDHTEGIVVPIAAVARGAVIIEKHFTLDRNLPGPDHKASLEPDELKKMVQAIRQVEKALGNPQKIPTQAEQKNMQVARKSLVAAKTIKKGEPFTPDNLTIKRPGNGVSPFCYWDLLGKQARRDYEKDEVVKE